MSLEGGTFGALNKLVAKTIGHTGFHVMAKVMDLASDGDQDPPEEDEMVMMAEVQGEPDAAFQAELNAMRENGRQAIADALERVTQTDAKPDSLTIDYSFAPNSTPFSSDFGYSSYLSTPFNGNFNVSQMATSI